MPLVCYSTFTQDPMCGEKCLFPCYYSAILAIYACKSFSSTRVVAHVAGTHQTKLAPTIYRVSIKPLFTAGTVYISYQLLPSLDIMFQNKCTTPAYIASSLCSTTFVADDVSVMLLEFSRIFDPSLEFTLRCCPVCYSSDDEQCTRADVGRRGQSRRHRRLLAVILWHLL